MKYFDQLLSIFLLVNSAWMFRYYRDWRSRRGRAYRFWAPLALMVSAVSLFVALFIALATFGVVK
jgi:hypothetical protein